jgi:branched-chain amino acid transport system permease protein
MRPLDRFWLVLLVVPPLAGALLGDGYLVHVVTLVGIYALLGAGYQLVFGQLGGLSLAQGALFGVGAYVTALLAPHLGVFALPLSVVAAGLVALVAGWPTLRLQSHYFALATLALAALAGLVSLNWEQVTGGANGLIGFGRGLPRGVLLLALVWFCLIVVVVVQARLFSQTWGERARLVREAPLVAASRGIDAGRWRLAAFVIGGALAGGAGAAAACLNGVVSPETTGFPLMVLCLTLVVLGGSRHAMGAVLGAALAVCLPELLRDFQGAWLLAYAAASLLVILFAPDGLAAAIDRLRGVAPTSPVAASMPERLPSAIGGERLEVAGLGKRFGGVEALKDVSLSLRRGEIVGLIGPNGSGKTTLLNAISGFEPPDAGAIRLDGQAIDGWPAHSIARAGIGRSFQAHRGGDDLVELAMGRASFLLLDEPAAGLGERERDELAALLRRLREAGRGVLIVDHDVDLLSRLCDRLVCLDRGAVVAAGMPDQVRADPRVRASFLGLAAA